VLTALSGPSNEHESLLRLPTYISGQNDNYKVTVRSNGLVLPTLDGVATKAVNMNKPQVRQLSVAAFRLIGVQ
jgi:hypothetical protein